MDIEALFVGSIGVLAETSDIQRRAYNQALAEAGVDWHWDEEPSRDLLAGRGSSNSASPAMPACPMRRSSGFTLARPKLPATKSSIAA